MPATPSNVPAYVPAAHAKTWAEIWNGEYEAQKKNGKSDKEAEHIAFAAANAWLKKQGVIISQKSEEIDMETRVTKKEGDGDHPASHYVVVEDPDKPSTWHLRVKDASGKVDHRLMGAAWAALHGGYRGNKYEGPQKAEAISKLRALYKSEGLAVPEERSEIAFLEKRICPVSELRVEGRRDPVLVGHAALFKQLSEPIMDFRERIAPGTFTRTLVENPDVRALLNHDPNIVLGRTVAKTLTLTEDEKGLRAEILLPRTHQGEDLAETIRRGDVNQMSFGFRTRKDAWTREGREDIRELQDVDLYDVSVVTFPSYAQTRVEIRSYIKFLEERELVQEAEIAVEAAKVAPGTGPEVEKVLENIRERRVRLAGWKSPFGT